jgi:prophage tail gpP-like protein
MRLVISGKQFSNFKSYEVNLTFNKIASDFSFSAQYSFLDRLIDYPPCEIYNDSNQLLIRGTILPPTTRSSPMPEVITVKGYSSPGVLEDSNIPVSLYPLQFDGMNLEGSRRIC